MISVGDLDLLVTVTLISVWIVFGLLLWSH